MRRNYSKVIEEMRNTHGLNLVAIGQRIGTTPEQLASGHRASTNPTRTAERKSIIYTER
ncbi:hypothetical protein [Streptococcus suis]